MGKAVRDPFLWYTAVMKQAVKDRAIILRRKPMGEADLLLTLYTENHGKVRVIAKGARKITSKLLGYTELFTLIRCQIDFRSSIPIVSQVSHERLFDGVAENQQLYERLHILAELVDRGCEEHEANPALFRCLTGGMELLVQSNHALLLATLVHNVTQLLGFSPQLTTCAHCDMPLDSSQALAWSDAHGGVVSCESVVKLGIPLSIDDIKVLRYISRTSVGQVERLRIEDALAQRVERLLLSHAQFALEQDFMAPKVVGALRNA